MVSRLKKTKMVVPIIALAFQLSNAHAIGLGGAKAGKKFKYEACSKIEEGVTKIDEVEKILKGKPMTTGKSGKLFFKNFYYEKSGRFVAR